MTDDTTTEEETVDETVEIDDTSVDDTAAESASEEEAAAPAAPVGAGLANEWTGGAVAADPEPAEVEAEVIDEDELLAADEDDDDERYISPYDRPGRWFVLHTQSGYEKKVKQNLEARTASMICFVKYHCLMKR